MTTSPRTRRRTLTLADVRSLLTAHEVAEALGVTTKTLRNWRYQGRGPTVTYVGSQPRYREADVLAWVERSNRAA